MFILMFLFFITTIMFSVLMAITFKDLKEIRLEIIELELEIEQLEAHNE